MIYARIKDMNIVPSNRREWISFLESNDGKDVMVKRVTGTRSVPQNSYYFGVVLECISRTTGHSATELHEIFKRMFLPPIVTVYRGREIRMPGSTSRLNKSEFSEYVMRISAEAAQMGIEVPKADRDDGGEIDRPTEDAGEMSRNQKF